MGGKCVEDWLKIKTEYITTDTSYRKLAEKYGVHYQTICARSKAEGWIQLREQYQNRTITKTVEQISNKTAKQAAKVGDLADKLLVMAALLIFIEDGTIPAWAVAIILGREFIVSALRMVAASEGLVIAANMWGKAKTMITMITLIFLLCPIGPILLGPVSLQDIMIWITVIITTISGVTYIIDNFSVIKDGFTQKGA